MQIFTVYLSEKTYSNLQSEEGEVMHRYVHIQGYLCWELVIVFALCACMLKLSSPYYHHLVVKTTTLQNDIARSSALLPGDFRRSV